MELGQLRRTPGERAEHHANHSPSGGEPRPQGECHSARGVTRSLPAPPSPAGSHMGHTPEPNEQRAPAHTLTPPPGSIAPERAGGEQGDPDLTPEPLRAGTPQPRLGPSSSFRHEAGPDSMPCPGQAQPAQCPHRQAVQALQEAGDILPWLSLAGAEAHAAC